MEKSIWSAEYGVLLKLIRETRQAAKVTQVQLAKEIGQSQSFVSKVEVGERRLDVIQLRMMLHALGTTLPTFIAKLEEQLRSEGGRGHSR